MAKNRISILIICFFISGLSVAFLTFISAFINTSSNHFVRMLPSHKIFGQNFIDLKITGYYFAGLDHDFVYLGNKLQKSALLKVRVEERYVQVSELKFAKEFRLYSDSYISVDCNRVFLFEGNRSEIWRGSQSSCVLSDRISVPQFARGITLSSTSFLFRKINKFNENELVKQAPGKVVTASNLLQKQIDGLFCTDGQLIKVPNLNKIFYTYYYRNQFICADTNLNLLYRGKTIDTNIHAKIKVARIQSRNELTLASPPLFVNMHAAANETYLFIHSGLKADNETDEMHGEAAAIDVYNVSDGTYKLSFYLPNFDGNKLTDFRVAGQSLYALYDHYLYKYQLNF